MKCPDPVRVLSPPPIAIWPLLAGLALALVAGCTAPTSRTAPGPAPDSFGPGAPDWVGQPDGWGKLGEIEHWLATDADRYDAYWRIQGELALGEGRTELAREHLAEGGSRTGAWTFRVGSARAGFERVLAEAEANAAQRDRARDGLARLDRLEGKATGEGIPATCLPRSSWRAKPPVGTRLTAARVPWSRITVHHSAEVSGARFDGSLADSAAALRSIQRAHMENRRYGDIGYHFLIDPAGRVFQGRSLAYQGAHAGGANNRGNLGVCLLGDFEKSRPTRQSLDALSRLLGDLRQRWRIPRTAVVCHCELKSTLCPGKHLVRWTGEYRRSGPALAKGDVEARPAAAKPSSGRWSSSGQGDGSRSVK